MKRQNEPSPTDLLPSSSKTKAISASEPSVSSDDDDSDSEVSPEGFQQLAEPHIEDKEEAAALQQELEAFERLTPVSKYVQFRSQAYEIKQLRRKLRKTEAKRGRKLENELRRTKDSLHSAATELPDQRFLVENLLRALNDSILLPNSFQYDKICTLLRNALGTGASHDEYLAIPGKVVAITHREGQEYRKLPNNLELYRALLGESAAVQKLSKTSDGDRQEAEQYFRLQAEILKHMTFPQFVSSMVQSRSKQF